MIRSQELQAPESTRRRVPIFAVSASLVEEELETYVSAGFDGWILKPIDFHRLGTLLQGIVDPVVRTECRYVEKAGAWERGGWFVGADGAAMGSNPTQQVPGKWLHVSGESYVAAVAVQEEDEDADEETPKAEPQLSSTS